MIGPNPRLCVSSPGASEPALRADSYATLCVCAVLTRKPLPFFLTLQMLSKEGGALRGVVLSTETPLRPFTASKRKKRT